MSIQPHGCKPVYPLLPLLSSIVLKLKIGHIHIFVQYIQDLYSFQNLFIMHEFAVLFFFSLIALNANISTQVEQFHTKLRKNSTVYTFVTALLFQTKNFYLFLPRKRNTFFKSLFVVAFVIFENSRDCPWKGKNELFKSQ